MATVFSRAGAFAWPFPALPWWPSEWLGAWKGHDPCHVLWSTRGHLSTRGAILEFWALVPAGWEEVEGSADLLSWGWCCAPPRGGQGSSWRENRVAPGRLDLNLRWGVGGMSGMELELENSKRH